MLLLCVLIGALLINNSVAYSFLHSNGSQMQDVNNNKVILKGLNLGGWAVQEGYMLNPAGSSNVGTQWQMKRQYYNEGQTDDQVEAFYSSWRELFVTESDIEYISSLGFNCVRLPLHYELFLTARQRAVRNSVIHNSDNYGKYLTSLSDWVNSNEIAVDSSIDAFKMIDNVLNWCGKRSMYVIVDMHAAPGAQGSDINIADALFANNLWENAWVFQKVLNSIWLRIAEKYKADARIAFYDILNEPNNVPNGNPPIHDLLQTLIATIRNAGDNHMIMIEGNGWGNQYNYLEPYTFSPNWGIVYNAHRYGCSTSTTATNPDANQINEIGNMLAFSSKYNVPVFVGETGENSASWMSANIAALDAAGIGWAHWTYKRFDTGENAALLRVPGSWPTDGAKVMSDVLRNIRFENCVKNLNTIAAVAPVSTALDTPAVGSTIWLANLGKFMNSGDGKGVVACSSTSVGTWEKFLVVSAGDGQIALRCNNGKFLSSENGERPMTCSRDAVSGWEAFEVRPVAEGGHQVSLRGVNGKYVSSEGGATSGVTCSRASVSGWEAFDWSAIVPTLAAGAGAGAGADDPANGGRMIQDVDRTLSGHTAARDVLI